MEGVCSHERGEVQLITCLSTLGGLFRYREHLYADFFSDTQTYEIFMRNLMGPIGPSQEDQG